MKRAVRFLSPPKFTKVFKPELDGLQIRRLGAARVGNDVERHFLAFLQGAHARRFDGRGMDEHVLAAAFRRDEAKTLGGVEELYGSDGHLSFPSSDPSGRHARKAAIENDHRKGSCLVQARIKRVGNSNSALQLT